MSYSFNTYQGKGSVVPFSTKFNLSGYTFAVQFDQTSDFSAPTQVGSATYNNGTVTMTLTSAQIDSVKSAYFRIKATRTSDSSFFYFISGRTYYVATTPSYPTSDLIGSDGYLKSEYLPPGGTAADATSVIKGVVRLSGDLGGTALSPTVPGLVAKYVKPAGGIPESDLASVVQSKLNSGGATVSDATTSTKGIIMLAGDLAGTSSSPSVPGLALKAPIDSPTFTGTVSGVSKSMVGLANVDNTSDTNKPISTAQQSALNLKAPIASPTFTGTVSGISKAMVGLANVDNTTDAAKPVSTAQQTALDAKAPTASPTFTGTVSGITAAMVGLGNVNNTSDASKPVSTAQQSAIDVKYTKPGTGIPESDLSSSVQGKLNQILILGATDPVPANTPANTLIFRKSA